MNVFLTVKWCRNQALARSECLPYSKVFMTLFVLNVMLTINFVFIVLDSDYCLVLGLLQVPILMKRRGSLLASTTEVLVIKLFVDVTSLDISCLRNWKFPWVRKGEKCIFQPEFYPSCLFLPELCNSVYFIPNYIKTQKILHEL